MLLPSSNVPDVVDALAAVVEGAIAVDALEAAAIAEDAIAFEPEGYVAMMADWRRRICEE